MSTLLPDPAVKATDNMLKLRDGRQLGYAEYGDPNGKPIFYFHGWPSSRLEASHYHKAGVKHSARIIGVDRPGLGLSDFKPGFTVSQWPDDVLELANSLDINRFAVVGISSGAPYAFACARFIPQRLSMAGVVSGVGPLDVPDPGKYMVKLELQLIAIANKAPWLARLLLRFMLFDPLKRNPTKFLAELDKDSPEVDKDVFRQHPEFEDEFVQGILECARQGMRGPVASIALEGKPWGFRLEDVTMRFQIWQGELDNLVYPATAHYLAERLPNSVLKMYPKEAHMSTVVNHAGEVVSVLTGT